MTIRKTHRGASLDLDALMASQTAKGSTAVGNMRVNANGDVIGPGGQIVQPNEERVRAYYKANPRSSVNKASLKGELPAQSQKIQPDVAVPEPKTAKTAKENVRTKKPAPVEPDEFAAPEGVEPVGYREVELPNGDIEMVPVYKEDKQ